jgi:SAM-dependent methyltransferase
MVGVARSAAISEGVERAAFFAAIWEIAEERESSLRSFPPLADAATCVSVFHYFQEPLAALRHVRDSLRPGGTFLLLDRARDASPGTAAWAFLHQHLVRNPVRFYRTPDLVVMLREVGFVDVRVLTRVSRLFWKGKIHTSLVLLGANVPNL